MDVESSKILLEHLAQTPTEIQSGMLSIARSSDVINHGGQLFLTVRYEAIRDQMIQQQRKVRRDTVVACVVLFSTLVLTLLYIRY